MEEYNAVLPNEIAIILAENLLKHDPNGIEALFNKTATENEHVLIETRDLVNFGDFLESKNEQIKNIGIDFPILFEHPGKPRLAIIAMDPKRNDTHGIKTAQVLLGSVFALNNPSNRSTNRNDYWDFIEPLLADYSVYLTDVYKIYYDTKGINNQKVSNKDKLFKNKMILGKDGVTINIHKYLLDLELEYIFREANSQQHLMIAMGKEAELAICELLAIKKEKDAVFVSHGQINILFIPHISRTVTQSIKTISKLYEAIGLLKNMRKKDNSGDEYIKTGKSIFDLKNELLT
jgi:hypothetical protein